MRKFFEVNVQNYVKEKNFNVYRPASLNNPKDNAVMFVTAGFMKYSNALLECENSLVFWPQNILVPREINSRHAVFCCADPHKEYCRFYKENEIVYLPQIEEYDFKNGAYIAKEAKIGEGCKIFPSAYIGGEVTIGKNVYIGSGVKLIGKIYIGDNVVIRENSVIGADGLSTDRDEDGVALTMPQFGGVILGDDVQIGANTTIARGAIDDTVISRGCKIDNNCFISHNNFLEENVFVVGETISFGSVTIKKNAHISGNVTLRNGITIGENAVVGMGAVVTKNVEYGCIVKGNPAR